MCKEKQYDLFNEQDDDGCQIVSIVPNTPTQKVRHMILKEIGSLDRVDEPVSIENYRENLLNYADVLEESAIHLMSLNLAELKPSITKQVMVIARLRHRFR